MCTSSNIGKEWIVWFGICGQHKFHLSKFSVAIDRGVSWWHGECTFCQRLGQRSKQVQHNKDRCECGTSGGPDLSQVKQHFGSRQFHISEGVEISDCGWMDVNSNTRYLQRQDFRSHDKMGQMNWCGWGLRWKIIILNWTEWAKCKTVMTCHWTLTI
jgi:hypothetical protein